MKNLYHFTRKEQLLRLFVPTTLVVVDVTTV